MSKKRPAYFSIILVIALLLTMSACAEDKMLKSIDDCYQIRNNGDLTYSYEIMNLKGKVIYSESSVVKAPTIKPLSPSVLEVSAQAGTGLSTNRAVFCDVKNSNVSETFYYVLGAKDGYVFYVEYIENEYSIICQSIFDTDSYRQVYSLEDPLIVPDSFSRADLEIDGVAIISYLSGDTEKHITVYFPN